MNPLSLNLDDLRFDDLVAAAQARLPALAPAWTDYNLHDPGITLVDLMAWSTEAQIYALARLRRDEREAYARLMLPTSTRAVASAPAGAAASDPLAALSGPQPASGLIWPDEDGAGWALADLRASTTLGAEAALRPADADGPRLQPGLTARLFRHRLTGLVRLAADGRRIDLGQTNRNGRLAYAPFGPQAGANDRLRLELECADPAALASDGLAGAGLLCLGVRVAEGVATHPDAPAVRLRVHLQAGGLDLPLVVRQDSTGGWTRHGVIALQLPSSLPPLQRLALEISAPQGFHVPPCVRRLALCVLPVRQLQPVLDGSLRATGWPDQVIPLEQRPVGLDGAPARPSLAVDGQPWQAVEDLATAGPTDRVFHHAAAAGQLRLGNGLNGAVPRCGAKLEVTYLTSEGAAGNQFRSRAWTAIGVAPLGHNLDPLTGGQDAADAGALRSLARQQLGSRHPLVTAADIEAAALERQDLRVGRAEVVERAGQAGLVTLLLLRSRRTDEGAEPAGQAAESQRWLATLRGLLQPRLPLGVRLQVRAPDYVAITIQATLVIDPRRPAAQASAAAEAELRQRLAAISADRSRPPRPLGLALTTADLRAWLRQVEGVRQVESLSLKDGAGVLVETLDPGPWGLPQLGRQALQLDVQRSSGSPA